MGSERRLGERALSGALAMALALGSLLIYARSCGNGFVYDDAQFVVDNPGVRAGLSPEGVAWAFGSTYAANWHPCTWLSLQLDQELFGLEPWGYHLTNLLLHTANTVLLFAWLARLTGSPWPSALVAALFAVHPLHVESVAWVSERKDVLSTLGGFLAITSYARYAARPGAGRYLAVAGALAFGLAAKSMLVTWPFVLLLLDYWPLGRLGAWSADNPYAIQRRSVWRLVVEKLPLLGLAAAAAYLTLLAQRRAGEMNPWASLPARAAQAVVAYAAYLGKTIWPADLAAFYPYPPGMVYAIGRVMGSALLLGAITILAIRVGRRRRYVFVGWFWYLGTLVPVIGLVQVLGGHALADRYTYVPVIGLFIVLAWGLADLVRSRFLSAAAVGIASGAALAACVVLTWAQQGYWHDPWALWRHALRVTQHNHLAHNNLAVEYEYAGNYAEALRHYAAAVEAKPDYAEGHNNLGQLLQRLGKPREALSHFQQAIACAPHFAEAYANLGQALGEQGRWEEAVEFGARAVELAPDSARARRNYAMALLQRGDVAEAAAQAEAVLALEPEQASAHNILGTALALQGKWQQAVAAQQRAIECSPAFGRYRYDLGRCLMEVGERTAAAAAYAEGRRLDPRWPDSAARVAWSLATDPKVNARNGPLALYWARQACEATGFAAVEPLDALAAAYAEYGRFAEAVATARQALSAPDCSPERARLIRERLALYASGRAYRR